MNQSPIEHNRQPAFYALSHLEESAILPDLYPGDMITFENGKPEDLVRLADCLAVDLRRDRDKPYLDDVRTQLQSQGVNYDALSVDEQDEYYPIQLHDFLRSKHDTLDMKKRVMHQFKTGIEILSAELISKGPVLVVSSKITEYEGWMVRITPSLRLPGMIELEDATFTFAVIHDGKRLRFGPYNKNKQVIGNVSSESMLRAVSVARGVAGVALYSAGGQGRSPKAKSDFLD